MTSHYSSSGLVTHLGPSRRQRLTRQRWMLIGVVAAATAVVSIFGQIADRQSSADREQAASVAVAAASF